MTLNELKQNTQISGFFYLDGNDSYLINDAVKYFKTLASDPSMNMTLISASSSYSDLELALLSFSFNNEPNVIIVKELPSDFKASEKKKLIELITNYNGNNICLFACSEKLTSDLTAHMKSIDCKKPDPRNAKAYYVTFIKNKCNNNIEYFAAVKLAEMTQYDLLKIENECKKLMAFKTFDSNKLITLQNVQNITSIDYDEEYYTIANRLNAKDYETAISELTKLKKTVKNPSAVLVSLGSQFQTIFFVRITKHTEKETMKLLNIKSEYRLKRIKEDTKFSPIELKNILAILRKYESLFKNGIISEANALDCALAEIIAIKK
ncbi:MAG: hypothetical protein K5765_00395 [Clostridia bacterium]|nr:hypothetical protein [Clostridia bacterium]